jgi:hypothetical protein
MTDPSPFAKLAALYSRGPSNGASSNPVDLALARCATAEANLQSARAAARAAAKAHGVKLAGLFQSSQFVNRSWAERIADERGHEEYEAGKQEAYRELTRIFCGGNYEAALAQAKVSMKVGEKHAGRVQAEMRDAGFFDAVEAGKLKLAGKILRELFPDGDRRNAQLARQIIAAGVRRDSDPSNERPDPTGLAKQIVDAGRKRRGEID